MNSGQSWFARTRAFFSNLFNNDFKWPPRHADIMIATHRHNEANPLPMARGETITLQRGPGGYEEIKSGATAFSKAGTRVWHEPQRPVSNARSAYPNPGYAHPFGNRTP